VNAQSGSIDKHTRIATALLLVTLLLAAALRFYRLDAQSLWNDEGTSVALAQRDLRTIAHDAALDIHPPLYYWLLSGWVRLAGTGESAVRALSALLGVVLVALTYGLGRRLAGPWTGLAAAFLAAVQPFQVYYSQEARMYMLLAVLAAGSILALSWLVERPSWPAFVALVVMEVAGLYTHYSYVFVVLVLNLAYALWLVLTWRRQSVTWRALNWVLSQVAVLLLYVPWLPTAIQRVAAWPSPAQMAAAPAGLRVMLVETWRWLVFGPTIETVQVTLLLLVAGLLAIFGALSLGLAWMRRPARLPAIWSAGLLVMWLGVPVFMMFALGLYREGYLKFLLVTAPAVSVLLACGLTSSPPLASGPTHRLLRALQIVAGLCIVLSSALVLRNYYTEPAYARDDYRGIVAYVDAMGRPNDAILLNAPGQKEVFSYYYGGGLSVYALPEDRPLDPQATESALAELARPGGRVYAVLWATDESDPGRFVEGWLDDHAYKALDSWYGNVRLVVYAVPESTPSALDPPQHRLDAPLKSADTADEVILAGYRLLNDRLAAGDIAQITLFWHVAQTPSQRYKVFVHVLDQDSHIVGQRDSEPGGGARLTSLWPPGETIADHYGVPVHPATPPGEYRVEVGMYGLETGQRLVTPGGEGQVWLQPLVMERPEAPPPVTALGMQHEEGIAFGELNLLGYDAFKQGFAHQPEPSLRPGDVLHVNLYWQAESQPTGDWHVTVALVGTDGGELVGLAAEPVGDYPTSDWQRGDVWRGQFNLAVPADAPSGSYRIQVRPQAPDGPSPGTFLSEPLRVQR
jgi:mannosyltransferase